MTNPNLFLFIIVSILLIYNIPVYESTNQAFGQEKVKAQTLTSSLDNIKSFIVSDEEVFFLESVTDERSKVGFYPDTEFKKIKKEGIIVKLLNAIDLMGPRELSIWGDHAYLVTLSDSCLGETVCNMGKIIRVPKNGGEIQTVLDDVVMKIDLAFDKNYIYFTEGNVSIWRVKFDGTEKMFIAEDNGIPSDIQVAGDYVYYMLEGENGSIKRTQKDGSGTVEVLTDDLLYPYNLRIYEDYAYWIEDVEEDVIGTENYEVVKRIPLNQKGIIEDVRKILSLKVFDGGIAQSNIEISKDFIFNTDISKIPETIQMLAVRDDSVQDLLVTDFLVQDMIFEDNSLYILGFDGKHGIWKVDLSTVVPEFPITIIAVSIAMLAMIMISRTIQKSNLPA